MKFFKFIYITCFSLMLFGCNLAGYNQLSSDADALTGEWQDKHGMISVFNAGKFETHTPDTNEELSEGSYIIDEENPSIVNIELKSLVKGTISQVTCHFFNLNRNLSCVIQPNEDDENSVSKNFQLSRIN